ncbi:hypothetical protein BDV28DRAFT_136464 [Aspergillus coremiiformis]|uniref:Septin-type G domain-containing protein n=1 Tax=Aspergillus coremiiformis TaxID=138285 RepID=A0A5N6Z283_9EURO|nr:hypothetical protein BDV28DRAFT_136464 [Aspergillus coremiiformis]
MRPPVPDVTLRRSRKLSIEQQWIDPRNTGPATFFLARGRDFEAEEELSHDGSVPSRDSMYGVQSLEEAVHDANFTASECEPDLLGRNSEPTTPIGQEQQQQQQQSPRDNPDNHDSDASWLPRRKSTLKTSDLLNSSRLGISLPSSNRTSPRPLTPSNLSNSDDPSSSLPSSPKSLSNQSLRHLDDISITDDVSSQAVASEEDNEFSTPSNLGPDSTSQLVMPSIRMPSRRPFTDRGKSLGRLKVLIAGASGTGKTSLIKSIVQACEDIVHVDAFPSLSNSKTSRSPRSSSRPSQTRSIPPTVTEVYASTKPYPVWWSDLEDSRVLRRRKSTGDVVLERNICFVDTQANPLDCAAPIENIIQYIHQQLLRAMTSLYSSAHDFQNMLAGNGGAQVDAVLYLISEDSLATDIESIRKLCHWTNVIPIISKSDLLTPDRVSALKSTFHKQAQEAKINPFLFGDASLGEAHGLNAQCPFAVSSAKSDDDDVMDASTLMSPDYVQPLMASELTFLVQTLFDRENIVWIRHSAAKKLALRQQEQAYWQHAALHNDVLPGIHTLEGSSPSYAMARISDYTRHEERLARVQLAKWASDLHQSLQNERERYAAMARGERAVWLTERLRECVMDGSLVPISQSPGFCGLRGPMEKAGGGLLVRTQNGQQVEYRIAQISPHDPLGLLWWSEDVKRRGWVIIQIVGSFGVVGGLALWLAKAWGLSSRSFSEWRFDWCCTGH